jgi:predicted nucleic acid-binding protein
LYNADDLSHSHAVDIAAAMHRRLFTTNYIVAETHALLLRRLRRDVAFRFLGEVDQSRAIVVRVYASDELRVRDIIAIHDDKDYSLTDATSFAAMERLHIGAAFTFDRHFAQYGFAVLGPEQR